MKLENLALWDERDLFTEMADDEQGYRGYRKYVFTPSGISLRSNTMKLNLNEESYELESLILMLQKPGGNFLFRSVVDMQVYCIGEMNAHIPYAFHRECYGFRVAGEHLVWYIACTTWNERCHFTLYAYQKDTLRKYLAGKHGLPAVCHGVYPYTGEQITIFFGQRDFSRFPQHGADMEANEIVVSEANRRLNISPAQRKAMECGVIFGWDTPMAQPENYDCDGRYCPEEKEGKRKR